MADLIKYDLRGRTKYQKHFGINDIIYSMEQGYDTHNVPKMIILEKQPKYPIYNENISNALTDLGEGLFKFFAEALTKGTAKNVKDLIGSVGGNAIKQFGVTTGAIYGNILVDRISKEPSQYWKNKNKYMNMLQNLFYTETNNPVIASYELPFFSDYMWEADGGIGWEVNGIEKQIGDRMANTARSINIGYPVTPTWKYESKRLNTRYSFNLLNHDTESLNKNIKFLLAILPGMMHVLISLTENSNVTSQALNQTSVDLYELPGTGGQRVAEYYDKAKEAVKKSISDYASYFTTMFKSPNVYEVIVPGRFKWLWCTMSINVKCVGKIYNDVVEVEEVFKGDPTMIGFPEAFGIDVTVESLLPQSYNEFFNYLQSKDFEEGRKR